jgi:hypothetical protein
MRRRMSPRQIKALIETGHYSREPALVAEAMLERPGLRAFLGRDGRGGRTEAEAARPAGRSRAAAARGRPLR